MRKTETFIRAWKILEHTNTTQSACLCPYVHFLSGHETFRDIRLNNVCFIGKLTEFVMFVFTDWSPCGGVAGNVGGTVPASGDSWCPGPPSWMVSGWVLCPSSGSSGSRWVLGGLLSKEGEYLCDRWFSLRTKLQDNLQTQGGSGPSGPETS